MNRGQAAAGSPDETRLPANYNRRIRGHVLCAVIEMSVRPGRSRRKKTQRRARWVAGPNRRGADPVSWGGLHATDPEERDRTTSVCEWWMVVVARNEHKIAGFAPRWRETRARESGLLSFMSLIAPILLVVLLHVWVLCELIVAPEGVQVPGLGFVARNKSARGNTRVRVRIAPPPVRIRASSQDSACFRQRASRQHRLTARGYSNGRASHFRPAHAFTRDS